MVYIFLRKKERVKVVQLRLPQCKIRIAMYAVKTFPPSLLLPGRRQCFFSQYRKLFSSAALGMKLRIIFI